MMLRTMGNYEVALTKIETALDLEPENKTALFEKELIEAMMKMDSEIDIEYGPALKRIKMEETG
jgi:hypothetical protein